ncbi:MAG: hypothetical protein L3J47_11650, partial [Sulfurovum sp.]|nr:hypothetical protein [Sulfurovum sp.]
MSEDDEIVLDPAVVRRRLNRALSGSGEQKPTVESEVEDSDDEVKSVKPKRSRKRRKKSGKEEDGGEKVKTPSATEHREVCNADNESERVIGDDRGASELVEQFHTTPEVEKTCVETPDDHTSGETKEDDIEVVVESKDAIDGASTESDECESSEYEDDGIDYSFEGYGDIDDPDVVEEVLPSEEGAVEFDSIRAWAETLESAIPVADLISSTLSNAGVEVSEDQLIGFD